MPITVGTAVTPRLQDPAKHSHSGESTRATRTLPGHHRRCRQQQQQQASRADGNREKPGGIWKGREDVTRRGTPGTAAEGHQEQATGAAAEPGGSPVPVPCRRVLEVTRGRLVGAAVGG